MDRELRRALVRASERQRGLSAKHKYSGPEFVTYFEEQNAKIDKQEIKAEKLKISVLGINNVSRRSLSVVTC